MLTEKTFTIDGYSMNFAEGPQNGAPLVFLHGATLWWHDFEPLFQPLMQNWQVYACDMRGHGKSSRTPGKYQVENFAGDIVSFIQTQIQQPVVVVGHSLGSVIALFVAAQIPNIVKAIILIDPATVARNTPIQAIRGPGDWVIGVGEVLGARLSAKEFILESNPGIDEAGLQSIELMIRSVDPDFISMLVNNQYFESPVLEQEIVKIICPTLLIYGEMELGSIVPETEVDFLKKYIGQISTHKITGAGHSPHWEQIEATLTHINNFLAQVE